MPDWVHAVSVALAMFFAFAVGYTAGIHKILDDVVKDLIGQVTPASHRRELEKTREDTAAKLTRNIGMYTISFIVCLTLVIVGVLY